MPVDKSFIGRKGEPVTMHVERGKIREFAGAIKDDDPLYFDEAYAAREAGGIMPPVTFLQTASHWDDGRGRPKVPFDLKRVLHGEQEYEFLAPIHAGDVLTAVSTVVDVYEKPGKRGGSMNFAVTETEYRNQQGTLVARARHITIETANAPLDAELASVHQDAQPGEYVLLAVSDTGMGMPPEVKTHVFEPFFTTKEVGKGTGLGLATVYGIVRQSGGFLAVDSEPGRGSRFRIYFPRAEAGQAEAARTLPEPAAVGSGTVLLVEDEIGVRHLARAVLTRYGYRVLEAANGEEALRLTADHDEPIHLLLTDVVMPGMSGPELAVRFLSLRPAAQVLYASGYTDEAIVHHGVRDDSVPFLQKPFEPDDLLRRVRALLEGK